jgi:putative addiction module component (TIGR02574 family)
MLKPSGWSGPIWYDAAMDTNGSSQLYEAAMRLPEDEREQLALALLDSLSSAEEAAAVEQAWQEEIGRRIADVRSGAVTGIPWDEAEARKIMFHA